MAAWRNQVDAKVTITTDGVGSSPTAAIVD